MNKLTVGIADMKMARDEGVLITYALGSCIGIFSSLVTEEMRVKGKELGADEQLSKPEIGHLVDVMDGLLDKKKQAR